LCSSVPSTDALTSDTKDILEEITRFLNLEKLLPSYRFTVTVRSVTYGASFYLGVLISAALSVGEVNFG